MVRKNAGLITQPGMRWCAVARRRVFRDGHRFPGELVTPDGPSRTSEHDDCRSCSRVATTIVPCRNRASAGDRHRWRRG
jgi:hypothetical protein